MFGGELEVVIISTKDGVYKFEKGDYGDFVGKFLEGQYLDVIHIADLCFV